MRLPLALATLLIATACRHSAPEPAREPQPVGDRPLRPLIGVPPPPVTLCVLRDGQAVRVDAVYDPVRGDTTIGGRPVAEALPTDSPPYAEGVDWYVRGDPVRFAGRMMMKHGLPRILGAWEVRPVGRYRGLTLFAGADDDPASPGVVYLFVRPGCQFQPYQVDYTAGAVRG